MRQRRSRLGAPRRRRSPSVRAPSPCSRCHPGRSRSGSRLERRRSRLRAERTPPDSDPCTDHHGAQILVDPRTHRSSCGPMTAVGFVPPAQSPTFLDPWPAWTKLWAPSLKSACRSEKFILSVVSMFEVARSQSHPARRAAVEPTSPARPRSPRRRDVAGPVRHPRRLDRLTLSWQGGHWPGRTALTSNSPVHPSNPETVRFVAPSA
jgi:hypothetical protein